MFDLYYFESCPFCRKVLSFLEQNKVAFNQCDTQKDPAHRQKLMELGGKTQVPFLHDKKNNVKMYESDDIIAYVKKHFVS